MRSPPRAARWRKRPASPISTIRSATNSRKPLPYSGNKVARYYLAETDAEKIVLPVSPELGRPEHHEYRWVSFDEAEDLLPPRLAIVLEWARKTITS